MDVNGIIYHIENPQQFWSELEDLLVFPPRATLNQLDAALHQYAGLCAAYHEQYLQTPVQLDHACNVLLESELFTFHSERMCEMVLKDACETIDPHLQLILFKVLLMYGRNNPELLRSSKKWRPLMPLFMDHILVAYNAETEDNYAGSVSASGWQRGVVAPIEARLRLLAVGILYEVLRVQKLTIEDLRIFDNDFIAHLFDLVEETRDMQDETLNYSVIKLIVSLNEQFMVASLQPHHGHHHNGHSKQANQSAPEDNNRVLKVLISRLNSSKTFGENMIFMLNRANRTPEDLCMQLLILKLLFLLFTTKGTSEYFYTNDLYILVDVFLRELVDLDEESESLRHTYLRVLHPLLTKTQLRSLPYKRPQIVRTLESLISNSAIRDISPTTRRLVERCLAGEWCVQLRKPTIKGAERVSSPSPSERSAMSAVSGSGSEVMMSPMSFGPRSPQTPNSMASSNGSHSPHSQQGPPSPNHQRKKSIKSSKSVEHLRAKERNKKEKEASQYNNHLMPMTAANESSLSLTSIADALPAAGGHGAPSASTSLPVGGKRRVSDAAAGPGADAWQSTTILENIHSTAIKQHATTRSGSTGELVVVVEKETKQHNSSAKASSTNLNSNSHSTTNNGSGYSNSHTTSYPYQQTKEHAATLPPATSGVKTRRKPPAIPVSRTRAGGTMTAIAGSVGKPSPLSRVSAVMPS